jgi:hypothetical protein
MGTGDLNSCAKGILAGFYLWGGLKAALFNCNTWPAGPCASCNRQPIKVKKFHIPLKNSYLRQYI